MINAASDARYPNGSCQPWQNGFLASIIPPTSGGPGKDPSETKQDDLFRTRIVGILDGAGNRGLYRDGRDLGLL